MNEPTLNLRDIHLPDPVSWWPIAPGWWLLIITVFITAVIIFLFRKIYRSKQLKRDIHAELDVIKQQFQKTENRSQLAKSLSILLRRASISFYPAKNIAGLTGENWLAYLDSTNANPIKDKKFQSETGQALLTAPYLPENATLDFDTQGLINLCESWLLSSHNKILKQKTS